jgi:hypothetical protein
MEAICLIFQQQKRGTEHGQSHTVGHKHGSFFLEAAREAEGLGWKEWSALLLKKSLMQKMCPDASTHLELATAIHQRADAWGCQN